MVDARAGSLLREARGRARLSQAELAKRAGVAQSVISAYESSARQPSLPTLQRLVAATGLELEVRVRARTSPLRGPVGARVWKCRGQVREVAAHHGLSNPRVFGSVARGEESEGSDMDLLVDVATNIGLIGLARAQCELERLLGVHVDLVPARDLKPGVAESVLSEAVAL